MKQFDIPIALIFFNRPEFLKKQLQILKKIAPEKLYLISDGPRNDRPHEKEQVEKCRTLAEKEITWNCKIIKNYALENMGCFDRIANGASWVFEQEEMCIFLEDDSIPELTFFQYCKDLLLYYKNDSKIFWICGNNYLIDYKNQDSSSYLYTQQMFPCGWASWKRAWKYYDGYLTHYSNLEIRERVLNKISNRKIRNYKKTVWNRLYLDAKDNKRLYTWDHQWHFTLLEHDAFGIVPKKNQIMNIGIGPEATHGGIKLTKHLKQILMLKTLPLIFPLNHPSHLIVDSKFERSIEKKIKGIPSYILFLSKVKDVFFNKKRRKK